MRIVLIYLLILLLKKKKNEIKCQATVVYFFLKFLKRI